MIKNLHDTDAPLRPLCENIAPPVKNPSAEPDNSHMDQYSPRRLPLKIPEMLRSNSIDNGKSPAAVVKSSSQTDLNVVIHKNTKKVEELGKLKKEDGSTSSSARPDSSNSVAEEDLMLAASALEKLKSDRSIPSTSVTVNKSTSVSPGEVTVPSTVLSKPTIFDKMISHPLISNSINYVLEKTINSSNNNILQEENSVSALPANSTIPQTSKLSPLSYQTDQNNSVQTGFFTRKRGREIDLIDPLDSSSESKKAKLKNTHSAPNSTNRDFRFKRKNGGQNLRQQVAISSAVSAQKSLQDLKYLSGLNLNIESRKRLTMLIHFLKLGNSQLSERIDNLIQSVDAKRQRLAVKATNSGELRSNSEPDVNIQQIKSDIVTTVKKIVNVVSKVSAQSLSEPARSNVREALLKLPTNWATMLNNEAVFSVGLDDEYDFQNEDDDDDDDDDDDEDDEYEEAQENHVGSPSPIHMQKDVSKTENTVESIPTMIVNNQTMFQRKRKPSISRRLLTSLLRYRKTKGGGLEKNTLKVKKWFREKIKDQIMHDSSGKVLILAQESLDMVNKIINFCNESLDKAEHWNNNRQHQHQIELLQRLQQINGINSPAVINKGKEEAIETIVVRDTPKSSSEKVDGKKQ